MRQDPPFVKKHDPDAPLAYGWRVIRLPADAGDAGGVYEVVEPYASDLEHLIARRDLRSARALFFWLDTHGARCD